MWKVVAEDALRCTECRHEIPVEARCLSQIPPEMPDGIHRRNFENFCIGCKACSEAAMSLNDEDRSCYVKSLNHWYTPRAKTAIAEICACCGDAIPEKTWALVQKFYAWPDTEREMGADSAHIPDSLDGVAPRVITGLAPGDAPAGWSSLSSKTKWRFRTGGLGRGLGSRPPRMAQRLYEMEVPEPIRNLGERTVREYVNGRHKHFSHRISVANAPGKARAPSNVVLEDKAANLSRGSKNMGSASLAAAKKGQRVSAVKVATKSVVRGSVKAGVLAAATEAAISIPENFFHYRRGRKTRGQAVKDTTKSTAYAAAIGAAFAGAAKVAAMAGIGLSLGALGPPIMIAGGVIFAGAAIMRIHKAAKPDLPLDELRVFLCKEGPCKDVFAREIVAAE